MLRLNDVTLVAISRADHDGLLLAVDVCRQLCEFGAVRIFTSCPCEDPDVTRIPPLRAEDYGRFVIKELHKYVKTSHALIVGHDGFILNPDAWTDDFLQYDYIGAPFRFDDDMNVGNGDFSLRSKRFLETTGKVIEGPPWTPEDIILCRTHGKLLRAKEMKFAPTSLARIFAIGGDSTEGRVWNGQFGFHGRQTTDLSRWRPPPSLKLDPIALLKRTWELERVSAGQASRLRGQAKALSLHSRRLSDDLVGLQRCVRAMLLQTAMKEAGLGSQRERLSSRDIEDLTVEVFSNHPLAGALGVRFHRPRHRDAAPVKVDCEARREICGGRCCSLLVRMTREEVAKPCYHIDVDNPFTLLRDAKTGMCVHLRDGRCDIYEERPAVCACYTCVKDRRIWQDFDNMILGRRQRRLENHAQGQRKSTAHSEMDDATVGDSAGGFLCPEEQDNGL